MKMGGPGKVVEGDGMFVIGKRKFGVGRMHSKEHVYARTERGNGKIRRIAVPDKSADALAVFDKHMLPRTRICVDKVSTMAQRIRTLILCQKFRE